MTPATTCAVSFVLMGSILAQSSYYDAQDLTPTCSLLNQSMVEVINHAFSGFLELLVQYAKNPTATTNNPALLDIQTLPENTDKPQKISPACVRLQKKFDIGIISILTPISLLVLSYLKRLNLPAQPFKNS